MPPRGIDASGQRSVVLVIVLCCDCCALTEFCPVPELMENLVINRNYWQEQFDSSDAMR